jgi:hypothetical protein
MPAERTLVIRRVVVGFAGDFAAARVVETAAELARAFGAELFGLFIEDTLLAEAAAALPVRTIHPHTLQWQPLTPDLLFEAHALAARELQRRLLQQAAAAGVAARFEVVRADPAGALPQRTERTDVLVIAEPADPIARSVYPYARRVREALQAASPVLYLPHEARRTRGPVAALVRDAADPALALGALLALSVREPLIALVPGEAPAADEVARAARALADVTVVALPLPTTAGHAVDRALRPYRERLLVASRTEGFDPGPLLRLAAERTTALLLV